MFLLHYTDHSCSCFYLIFGVDLLLAVVQRDDEWADIAPGTTSRSDFSGLESMAIVHKTELTLKCPGKFPLIRFGAMTPKTKLLLQRFFAPWNDQLRRLLVGKGVASVPGYGFDRGSDPLRPFPSKPATKRSTTAAKENDLRPGAPRAFGEAPEKRGIWWWDYKFEREVDEPAGVTTEMDLSWSSEDLGPGEGGIIATTITPINATTRSEDDEWADLVKEQMLKTQGAEGAVHRASNESGHRSSERADHSGRNRGSSRHVHREAFIQLGGQ